MIPQEIQNQLSNQGKIPLGLNQGGRTNASACMVLILILIIFILFFIFGDGIFKFFNIEHVYHFIISVIIIIFLYAVGLFIASLFIKYPQDILTLLLDRLRNQ